MIVYFEVLNFSVPNNAFVSKTFLANVASFVYLAFSVADQIAESSNVLSLIS